MNNQTNQQPQFSVTDISKNVMKAKYAVRGLIVQRAIHISDEIAKGKDFPFEKVFMFNIGNPQALGQTPVTFMRQVLAACLYPPLLKTNIFPSDVSKKVKKILGPRMTMGAYSESKGLKVVRESVSEYLTKRDGYPSDPNNIFISDGASPAIRNLLQMIISSEKDGIMTPIPQYPIYTSNIAAFGGTVVGYYLDEENDWDPSLKEIERAYAKAVSNGVKPKAMVVINPGNPTGQVLSESSIRDIIDFAFRKGLLIMSDEVYQKNTYIKGHNFISFRKVLGNMGEKYQAQSLVSIDSVSKGVLGECGIRGGYIELQNFDEKVKVAYNKMVSMNLCSNVTGQVAVEVAVNPPVEGDESFPLFKKEYNEIFDSLRRRAVLIFERLNKIPGITCRPVMGALYSFPTIIIPEKAIKKAREEGKEADEFYCMQLLENVGICAVPGSGFWQKENTYHVRITILPPEENFDAVLTIFEKFHREFTGKYA